MSVDAPIFICVPTSKGQYVRLERIRLGLTQQELAQRANVNQAYISKIEHDQYVPYYVLDAVDNTLRQLAGTGDPNA